MFVVEGWRLLAVATTPASLRSSAASAGSSQISFSTESSLRAQENVRPVGTAGAAAAGVAAAGGSVPAAGGGVPGVPGGVTSGAAAFAASGSGAGVMSAALAAQAAPRRVSSDE